MRNRIKNKIIIGNQDFVKRKTLIGKIKIMKYNDAKKLHNGDEIVIKETNEILTVLRAYQPRPVNDIARKVILVECDDGNTYHHRNIK